MTSLCRDREVCAFHLDLAPDRLPKPFKLGGVNFWVETEIDDCLQSTADAAGQQ